MSDQKELKKRLKVLMNRPENQVCSDCPERQPRWASLIVPPPGAPEGSLPIGAFMCLECSGAHRRLGVHISFVRSINLDSWKEREVLSMENGGNAKVNAIFEARLNVPKPSNHADGPTRERFIRDKYERRKYYDAAAFQNLPQPQQQQQPPQQQQQAQQQNRPPPRRAHSQDDIAWSGSGTSSSLVGPPSDAARQRVEERNRQQRTIRKSSSISSDDSSGGGREGRRQGQGGGRRPARPGGTRGQRPKVPQAPTSAPPPQMDLLDFSSPEEQQQPPPPPPSPSRKSSRPKSKSKEGSNGGADSGAGTDLFADFLTARNESWAPTTPGTTVGSSTAIKNSASVSQDILSLYGSPSPQANGNMGGMMMNNNMAGMTNMMQQMNMNQHSQMQANMTPTQMQMMMQMQQQSQQQQMMMMNMHTSMPNLNYGGGAGMNFAAFSPQHAQQPTSNNFAATFSNGFGPDGFGHSMVANGGGPPLAASSFGHGFGTNQHAIPNGVGGGGRSVGGGGGGGRSVGGGGAASNRRLQHQNSAPPATSTMVNDDPFASLGNTRSHR